MASQAPTTYALEMWLNWTGLCSSKPTPRAKAYAKLKDSRRSAAKEHSAVCRRKQCSKPPASHKAGGVLLFLTDRQACLSAFA